MSSNSGREATGFSLIEMLVALTIAALLIVGAVTMYSQSRTTYRAAEAAARLQETARYALSFIDTDLRMANYWGLNSRPDYIQDGGLTVSACSTGWATDFNNYVQGFNDKKGLGCLQAADYARGDVLVVRRAATDREDGLLDQNVVYLQTSRIQGTLFLAAAGCKTSDETCLPPGYLPPQSETHRLLAHAYYLNPNSTGRVGVPSLRRLRLVAGPGIQPEEIIPGIEDMQLEFGIDTDFNATAEFYVAPEVALPAGARIVSVRVWLLVRAEEPDFQFVDGRTYNYAGKSFTPAASGNENRFRRLLVSKTIQLRNTRYEGL